MQKVNKIMMITVAALLTLVLITSSAVSGTFAKYASTGESSSSARVAKWGISVEVTPNMPDGFTADVASTDDTITFSTSALKMAPGSDYSDVIKLKFSGTAEVRLKVKIKANVVCTDDNIKIPAATAGKGAEAYFIPMGTTIKADENDEVTYITDPWFERPANSNAISTSFENAIASGFSKAGFEAVDGVAEKKFEPNDVIEFPIENQTVDEFYLGFDWPSNYTDDKGYDYIDIASYIMGSFSDEATIGITYIVTVEQVK